METAKLTLRPTKHIVALAHKLAKDDHTSITQMFSAFILARSQKSERHSSLAPLTRSVTGILKLPNDWNYKQEIADILEDKYGL